MWTNTLVVSVCCKEILSRLQKKTPLTKYTSVGVHVYQQNESTKHSG